VYATVNELLELVPLHHMDDQLWATIVDAFTRCNRSTDVVYSLIISTGQNNMGPLTITALLRAAILQSNLSQSLFLLQTASTSALLPLLPKISLIQLAASLAEQAQLPLAQDLVHSFVIPITANDHPDCIRGLVSLLRTCVNRSDVCPVWLLISNREQTNRKVLICISRPSYNNSLNRLYTTTLI
jgi:hypothetical protein